MDVSEYPTFTLVALGKSELLGFLKHTLAFRLNGVGLDHVGGDLLGRAAYQDVEAVTRLKKFSCHFQALRRVVEW